jgi:hypothetical protein
MTEVVKVLVQQSLVHRIFRFRPVRLLQNVRCTCQRSFGSSDFAADLINSFASELWALGSYNYLRQGRLRLVRLACALVRLPLSGCFDITGKITQDEVARVPGPSGGVDAVLFERNGGATPSFGYVVYVVPRGKWRCVPSGRRVYPTGPRSERSRARCLTPVGAVERSKDPASSRHPVSYGPHREPAWLGARSLTLGVRVLTMFV